MPEIILQARSNSIQDLVNLCAKGELAFSGENSLCSKVAAMGYKTTSLHEAVTQAEYFLNQELTK